MHATHRVCSRRAPLAKQGGDAHRRLRAGQQRNNLGRTQQIDVCLRTCTTAVSSSIQNGSMTLQSPFASADVQLGNGPAEVGSGQPEVVKHVSNRKRGRCPSADLDSSPLCKIPQPSNRQLDATAAPDPSPVTLHRPTPHRPTASTPCCFGVPSVSCPLQFGQLRNPSFVTARPSVPHAVPSSLATAAALASAAKSSGSDPSDDDQGSPTQPVCSQEFKLCQGNQQSATSYVLFTSTSCCSIDSVLCN